MSGAPGDPNPRPGEAPQPGAAPPDLDADVTLAAPSCPPALGAQAEAARPSPLHPGDRIDDFEIEGVLGRGAFAMVYLARQLSLDRQVALKVADSRGQEGRNLAQLEHEHVVQVFSETVDPSGRQRLLCMQYVPGPTLEAILQWLQLRDRHEWSGATLLDIVDKLTPFPASLEPAGLRDRERLARMDWTEAVCWIGARLAEALDYAHRHRVLHRDVKPANVLVSQYGRPMLVDFNLSFRPLEAPPSEPALFGGTLAYMAPEHLDAFNPEEPAGPETVREPADVYALGLVLFELLTGDQPFAGPLEGRSVAGMLHALAARRRTVAPSLPPEFPRPLGRTLERCLDPDPARRYGSAAEMGAALEGCREFHAAGKAMPATGRFWRFFARHPFRWLIALALLPNLLASAVQISYNQIRIISHLTEAQQATFARLLAYNAIVYPISIWLALRLLMPIYRAWRDARASPRVDAARIDAGRAMALALPAWVAWIAALGWTSGAIVFSQGLALLAGPVPWEVHAHLWVSFAISGLIALVYSFLAVECMVVCVLYRGLWSEAAGYRDRAAAELEPVARRVRAFQVLSGLIPLAGAVLMVAIGPQEFSAAEYQSFRFLVTALIGLGMAGFQLATLAAGLLARAVAALAGR